MANKLGGIENPPPENQTNILDFKYFDVDGHDDGGGDEEDLTVQEQCLVPRFVQHLASH